ncbi:MAG: S8 family serine peptidase [Ilumatobacter sp.]
MTYQRKSSKCQRAHSSVPNAPDQQRPLILQHVRRIAVFLLTAALVASSCASGDDADSGGETIDAAPVEAPASGSSPADTALPTFTEGTGTSPEGATQDGGTPADETPTQNPGGDPSNEDPATDLAQVESVAGTDPLIGEQWALDATNIPDAWSATGGKGVVIAIIDSGVDLDHPDLVDRLVSGWDFVDGDDQPDDPNGHGTHVAGIAAASSNDIGIAGAAPLASIMPIRVLDADGAGSDETIAESIRWAADSGADVINLSLGESGFISRFTRGSALNAAIREVSAQGVVVVAAAGNEGSAGQQYRIGVDVLVVNATDRDNTLTAFSNVGDTRAISAPGAVILSTAPTEPTTIWPEGSDGYEPLDGTSMAAPLVSGVAALAIAAGVDHATVAELLTETAANPSGDPRLGAGILDASAALGLAPVASQAEGDASIDEPIATPEDVPVEPEIEEQIREAFAAFDTTADATCAMNRRLLTVTVTLPDNDAGLLLVAELAVAGFTGSGSYPATGTLTASTPNQAPVTIPIASMADVDPSGSGSITLALDDEASVTFAWRCN